LRNTQCVEPEQQQSYSVTDQGLAKPAAASRRPSTAARFLPSCARVRMKSKPPAFARASSGPGGWRDSIGYAVEDPDRLEQARLVVATRVATADQLRQPRRGFPRFGEAARLTERFRRASGPRAARNADYEQAPVSSDRRSSARSWESRLGRMSSDTRPQDRRTGHREPLPPLPHLPRLRPGMARGF
jgi:hypothetical protein